MKRKRVSVLLAILFVSLLQLAEAQQRGKVPRIGYLTNEGRESPNAEAFRQGLKDLGYAEGQTIAMEYRSSERSTDRLPGLVAELVRLNVDIIVAAGGSQAVLAAKKATSSIPIVFVAGIDPVGSGLVASLARPGGNITGLTIGVQGLYGKRLEVLKETVPRLTRVGFLLNPANPAADGVLRETQAVGQALGVQIQSLEVRNLDDIDRALEAATKAQVGAVIVAQQTPITADLKRLVKLVAKTRLPAIYADTPWIRAGGLMSYGPSIPDLHRRSALYVDKILKGTKPADLPVEQPIKFELMINLKTAKALGLTIPQVVLMRAEKVIK